MARQVIEVTEACNNGVLYGDLATLKIYLQRFYDGSASWKDMTFYLNRCGIPRKEIK
jgi:hypothetical protein